MGEPSVQCLFCGKPHTLNEMALSFGLPDAVFGIPEGERAQRVKASDDLCSIDGRLFFVRSLLKLPILDHPGEYYQFGIWAQVGESDLQTILHHWTDPEQDILPPFRAYLGNNIPFCGDTSGLAVDLQLTGIETPPSLKLIDINTPLGQLQQSGIYLNDAMRFFHYDQDLPEGV